MVILVQIWAFLDNFDIFENPNYYLIAIWNSHYFQIQNLNTIWNSTISNTKFVNYFKYK